MRLEFNYSVESEADRIIYTLGRYAWYKENGYKINLPESLRTRAESGDAVEREEVMQILNNEFDEDEYIRASEILKDEFEKIRDDFEAKLKTLGGPVHEVYQVFITKYGVGGSYSLPSNITVNIDYGRPISWKTLAHEMVHLAIEDWIKEYEVKHWVKERIVDLTMQKFFPDEINPQGKAEDFVDIDKIFEADFPDAKKIIQKVSVISS